MGWGELTHFKQTFARPNIVSVPKNFINCKISKIYQHKLCAETKRNKKQKFMFKNKQSCFKCIKKYNTLLHKDTDSPFASVSNSDSLLPPSSSLPAPFVPQWCYTVMLFIRLKRCATRYSNRKNHSFGSEGSFVWEKLSNQLKLSLKQTSARISGRNNTISADVQKCEIILGSNTDENVEIAVSALVVPHQSNSLPSRSIDSTLISKLSPLQLADPCFYESSGCIKDICVSLVAQETAFGWILTGPDPTTNSWTTSLWIKIFQLKETQQGVK